MVEMASAILVEIADSIFEEIAVFIFRGSRERQRRRSNSLGDFGEEMASAIFAGRPINSRVHFARNIKVNVFAPGPDPRAPARRFVKVNVTVRSTLHVKVNNIC